MVVKIRQAKINLSEVERGKMEQVLIDLGLDLLML